MRNIFFAIVCLSAIAVNAQTLEQIESSRIKLPNGWSLTPVGKNIPLGDLPLNIAVSKSKKYIAVTNNGQSTQSIELFDVKKKRYWIVLIFPKAGTAYVSAKMKSICMQQAGMITGY